MQTTRFAYNCFCVCDTLISPHSYLIIAFVDAFRKNDITTAQTFKQSEMISITFYQYNSKQIKVAIIISLFAINRKHQASRSIVLQLNLVAKFTLFIQGSKQSLENISFHWWFHARAHHKDCTLGTSAARRAKPDPFNKKLSDTSWSVQCSDMKIGRVPQRCDF